MPPSRHWLVEAVFPRRLHRVNYFLRMLAADVVAAGFYAAGTAFNGPACLASIVVLALYILFFVMLPRIRDIGVNGWWLLAALVPGPNFVLGIILLFRAPALLHPPSPNSTEDPAGTPA